MSRATLFLPLALFTILVGVFYWVLTDEDYDPQALPSALLNKPVPTFSLTELTKQQLVNEHLFKAKVTVLNVWASWCLTCRIEHPFLQQLSDQGMNLIGLNYKDEPINARAWLNELGNPYHTVIADPKGQLGLDLGVYGAPETYLIDTNGIIRFKHVGELTPSIWEQSFAPLILTITADKTE